MKSKRPSPIPDPNPNSAESRARRKRIIHQKRLSTTARDSSVHGCYPVNDTSRSFRTPLKNISNISHGVSTYAHCGESSDGVWKSIESPSESSKRIADASNVFMSNRSSTTDIIGILTGSSGEQEFEKDGKVHKRVTIELDQDGVRLECAFFGDYVGLILGQLASGDMTNAVVVVQYAKIKPFRGRPSVQNVYGATRILFNPDVEEAEPLRARFFEKNDPATQVLSQLQDSGRVSVTQEFLNQAEGKSIEQIKDLAEKTTCVVLATIKFIPEGNPWWYPACKCNKKVIPADGMYFCENCVRHIITPIPRYKLQVRVMDHTESTTFIIFDQEASTLLNRSCASFVDLVTKDPANYPVPPEVLALIDKTFLFKIEVNNSSNSKFEPSYRVRKVCSDEDVITQFKSTLTLPDGSNLYQIVSTPTSVLRGESSSSSFYKNLDGDFGLAENSPDALTTSAPIMDLGHHIQNPVAGPVDIDNQVPAGTIEDVQSNVQQDMVDSPDEKAPELDMPIPQHVVPIAALVAAKKQVKMARKAKDKSFNGEELDGDSPITANLAGNGDYVGMDNVESPPSKRPTPYDEALGSSNMVKKPLKVVKKEK
ncbi:hypothetical protein OROGR_001249 [Orobanche gracilis]